MTRVLFCIFIILQQISLFCKKKNESSLGADRELPIEQPWRVVDNNGCSMQQKQSVLFHEESQHVGTQYYILSGHRSERPRRGQVQALWLWLMVQHISKDRSSWVILSSVQNKGQQESGFLLYLKPAPKAVQKVTPQIVQNKESTLKKNLHAVCYVLQKYQSHSLYEVYLI